MNAILFVAWFLCAAEPAASPPIDMPRVLDDRLQLELVCREPDIVTPTGLTIDAKGRILVIENHTHQRPEGYQGPPHDRILLIDPSETPVKPRVWFEGTKDTMNLARAPDDSIYVATRAEIFRLRDTDGDDKADERVEIAHLETAGNYPHNGLSGLAFPLHEGFRSDELYFGLGENLGATYKIVGSDGSVLGGGGEGGSIYACQFDGSKLRRAATGFWNPFAMTFDPNGDLFAVDNDPDSRPPCRLLHVVKGGDYGFKFRHGRKGTHPFIAWNGELPGTLPMVCGTGEAPSGLINDPYVDVVERGPGAQTLLATSWGDHRIERFRLETQGDSFVGTMHTVVSGGENFRPVGICSVPDGAIYFSDWVDKSYPVHGKGRVWKLSHKNPVGQRRGFYTYLAHFPNKRTGDELFVWLREQWQSFHRTDQTDAFTWNSRAAFLAQELHRRPTFDQDSLLAFLRDFTKPELPESTIWAAIAARNAHPENVEVLVPHLLKHDAPQARVLGVIWAGENAMLERRADVEHILEMPGLTRELFATTLAALEMFDRTDDPNAPQLDVTRRNLGDTYVLKALNDPKATAELRQFALKALPTNHSELKFDRLKQLIDDRDPTLRIEAIRTLRERTDAGRDELLRSIADDEVRSEAERAEASMGLNLDAPPRKLPNDSRSTAERIQSIGFHGDPVSGERLFFNPRIASCYRCHEYNGRGATIGPDLTTVGQGPNYYRILQSILEPSHEIAPHYVPWIIETTDGRTLTGLYLDKASKGEHRYADAQGRIFLVHPNDIEHREAAKQSIMPADFGKTLTDDELRDLSAFLLRQ